MFLKVGHLAEPKIKHCLQHPFSVKTTINARTSANSLPDINHKVHLHLYCSVFTLTTSLL